MVGVRLQGEVWAQGGAALRGDWAGALCVCV